MKEKQLLFEVKKKQDKINDLLVLIDTLQTNLRSAVSCLDEKSKNQITGVRSYQWCINWRDDSEGSGYSTIEGAIRQSTDNPEKKT
tara:strand:- start:8194 stop:8451 length:258 start_codon:yes stop_codon:yes gene_type:complete